MKSINLLMFFLPLALSQSPLFGLYTATNAYPNQLSIFIGNSSGQVTFSSQIETGGNGIAPGEGGLGSQDSLIVKDQFIFVVNPDSNSVSAFHIPDPKNPARVVLLNTAPSGGDFPTSLAAHPLGNILCVVNSGAACVVRCFTYDTTMGLTVISGSDRTLDIANLTTPPRFHEGPAQASFTPNGLGLVISNKGPVGTTPVFLYSFDYANKRFTDAVAKTQPKGDAPFSFTFDTNPKSDVILVDPAPVAGGFGGVEILETDTSATAPSISFVLPEFFQITNHSGACWIARSRNGNFFTVNTGSRDLTELQRVGNSFNVLAAYPATSPNGPTDISIATIDNIDYAFVQAGGAYLFSYDVSVPGKAILKQNTTIPANGPRGNGLAVYVVPSSGTTSPASRVVGSIFLTVFMLFMVSQVMGL